MKKLILIALSATFMYAQVATIIVNGVERKVNISNTQNSKISARATNSIHKGLIVAFKKSVDIDNFAKKYNLKLKKKLVANYYIFENNSDISDINLTTKIYKENSSAIKTIRPNWGFRNIAR